MPTAFEIAETESKLVHGIILWGNLDDQSCWGSGRTLRESALASPPIIDLLKVHFISFWVLVADLQVSTKDTNLYINNQQILYSLEPYCSFAPNILISIN